MHIRPIEGKVFGAVVSQVKLADLGDEAFAAIHQAFLRYGFLLFPGQFLSEAENIAFGERFGPLEFGALPLANQYKNDQGQFDEVIPLDTQRMRTNVGNEAWHTDSTYMPISSKCALLSAVTVPAAGGQTELADMRAAYAALDESLRESISHLSAYHSTQYSQAHDVGDFPPTVADTIYHGEAYLRPLVKTHPETGVKSLFIGRHAFGIPGMTRQESYQLLQDLLAFAVGDETRVYQHCWSAGDTLIWDNRALLHRARPYDYSQPRVLIGTRVAGDEASELAYYPRDPAAAAGRRALADELARLRGEIGDTLTRSCGAGEVSDLRG